MEMTSYRAYLIRSLNEWILDNGCTPYILVNALQDDVDVPQQYVKDGQIVLNISPSAVQGLHVNNDLLSFSARFAGRPTDVFVPVSAVMGIYARENGQGMVFDVVEAAVGGESRRGQLGDTDPSSHKMDSKDHQAERGPENGPEGAVQKEGRGNMNIRDATREGLADGKKGARPKDDNNGPDKPPRGGKRPNLRIVK